MNEELKNVIKDYLTARDYDVRKLDDIVEDYESSQCFAEQKDCSFEMVTGNTKASVIDWLEKQEEKNPKLFQ